MIVKQGDMWDVFEQVDLFCITTNAVLKKNGALVMGGGIAKQALDRFPSLDQQFGAAIAARGVPYGLLVLPDYPAIKIGAFQVKAHYRDAARLDLIELSTNMLHQWCADHPTAQVALNYPGIGLGQLDPSHVQPIIESLPDTVQVWQY